VQSRGGFKGVNAILLATVGPREHRGDQAGTGCPTAEEKAVAA